MLQPIYQPSLILPALSFIFQNASGIYDTIKYLCILMSALLHFNLFKDAGSSDTVQKSGMW
ncbi:unnamed protein product [Larinioides sclopetarius]|uniref:Uncharacterized protein n=1 Tax=Larinioides sclopetarius TaxID=280406 RepID=A0AAV1ZFR5_9ARAC